MTRPSSSEAMRHLFCISVFALGLAGGGVAFADESLIDRGIELRRAGKDAEALAVFEKAYERTGTARALAQVALAHQALGHWVEAEENLLQALKMGGPWIRKNEAPLRSALTKVQERLGTLEIRGEPEGAAVTVNGRSVGLLPLDEPVRVVSGDVVVQVTSEGHVAVTRRVPVESGKRVREVVRLVPQSGGLTAGANQAAAEASAPPEGSVLFGTPGTSSLILEAGYSSLPGITRLDPVSNWFAYGLKVGIDAGLFGSAAENVPGTLTFYGALPLILEMVDDPEWVARLSVTPGMGLTVIDYSSRLGINGTGNTGLDVTGEYFAVLVHASLDVGHRFNRWLTFGGGLDVPTTFFFGGGTDLAVGLGRQPEEFSVVPVLVGPTAEFRLSEQARVGLAVRLGPHFTTGDLAELGQLFGGNDPQTEFGFAARLAFAFAL